MMDFRPCILIPCYNHGETMPAVLEGVARYEMTTYVIDDGSHPATKSKLEDLTTHHDWVKLIRFDDNCGKGGAVTAGFRAAWCDGFTHAIQVDADGQHDLNDLPKLLEISRAAPDTLVSGRPIFDESIPKGRLYGRYVTHFWVCLETLSCDIKDSMCGFRVYPLAACIKLLETTRIGRRMDFDVEIMVRLVWDGVPIEFCETRVIYPEGVISHFDVLRDNLLISWMHTKLFFGMLKRLPDLFERRLGAQEHWSTIGERGSALGIKLMLLVYRFLGRGVFSIILYPVVGYFWLTGQSARAASRDYLTRIKAHANRTGTLLPSNHDLNSFRHFLNFGRSILDKAAAWQGDISAEDIDFFDEAFFRQTMEASQGALVIGAHLGNFELCRALGDRDEGVVINSLVFTLHAERFNSVLKSINPRVNLNLIQVSDLGPDTAILLQQKIDRGEWIFIVADRTPAQIGDATMVAEFLGKKAPFPKGPFILAALLGCPIYLMFGLNESDGFRVHFEHFADRLELQRGRRDEALGQIIQRFANRLEHYCMMAPLDWFNFFDFWKEQNGQS